jgi:hypothetical protein
MAAGQTIGSGVIARVGQGKVDPEQGSPSDDFRFGVVDEWSDDIDSLSLDSRLGRQSRHLLKSLNEFWAAIRVT